MAEDKNVDPDKLVKVVFVLTIVGVALFSAVIHLFIL